MDNPPNMFDKARHLAEAGLTWAKKDGLSTVSDEVLRQRLSACTQCELWDKNGFFGIGKCKYCGCSAAKLYIPSSTCPMRPPKWTIVPSDKSSTN